MEAISLSEHIGSNVRILRKALGLAQADLATAMSKRGFRWLRQTVDETEVGRRDATIEELLGLALVFDVPLALLVGRLEPVFGSAAKQVTVGDVRLAVEKVSDLIARDPDDVDQGSFHARRQKTLDARTTAPGPIFLYEGEGLFQRATPVPPWGETVVVSLKAGVPYVARDEYEAEKLLEAVDEGHLRVIDRHEAYRIRRRKRGAHQED